MISWTDVNILQKEKRELQVKLSELLKNPNVSKDEINELRSEILHLDKQIEKILGSNEIKRQEELKQKKSGIEQRNIKNYYSLKDKFKTISKMKLATTRMISEIEKMQKENVEEMVMVKR